MIQNEMTLVSMKFTVSSKQEGSGFDSDWGPKKYTSGGDFEDSRVFIVCIIYWLHAAEWRTEGWQKNQVNMDTRVHHHRFIHKCTQKVH